MRNKTGTALLYMLIMELALHNHVLYDNRGLFMMHFRAVDEPGKLAKGLKAAPELTNSKKY